jgi:hypothetical protein
LTRAGWPGLGRRRWQRLSYYDDFGTPALALRFGTKDRNVERKSCLDEPHGLAAEGG